ncbi:hypothetical protein ruthe_02703 [Rubellimicrobium thermophilum DSM 16684]|uniref:Uncharacterized protein n=1 Tax=Rubellimicrobium thermophilum DSM 16684 TaxID=1123069 RepID=S9QNV9_9RHOB|nr:hypothetical protein [Rubellimicrobium thermophilum]EPX83086.1 hypothetical protein ruthe_02703 [Rubellimicrobium thermophilum DSM 16684]
MPNTHRDGPVLVRLSGETARHLAERLLAPRAPAERLWQEIPALGAGAASPMTGIRRRAI